MKRWNRALWAALLTAPLLAAPACTMPDDGDDGGPAQQGQREISAIARERGIELPGLPWHLMVIWWDFDQGIPDFRRLDIDVDIDRDVPPDYRLYISPLNTAINGALLYAGLQTRIDGWRSREDHTLTFLEKGGIFSRWSRDQIEPIGLDYVDVFEDGLCVASTDEGAFCGVRRPYVWTKGSYTLSLVKEETVIFKNSYHTWVAFEVTDKAAGATQKIGRLLFEGSALAMRKSFGAFIETYGYDDVDQRLPEVTVTFGFPRINNEIPPLSSITARHSTSGVSASPNVAALSTRGGAISVSLDPDNLRPQPDTDEPLRLY